MNAPSARDAEAALTLGLLDISGFGPRRVLDLLLRWGEAQTVVDRLLSDSKTPATVREALQLLDPDAYGQVIQRTRALGGDFKLWSDESYPGNLSKWASRPPVLFYKGAIDSLTTRALALVGRVDPTDRGVDAATRFARLCVENNIDVVSGLAKGIDGASHRSALMDPPGNTYAVVGHGLDFAYPAENGDLYEQIPNHGAIISQFSTGVGPQRWTFPARNEAMCTLALGTVIVEGKEGCGSIIQADFSFKHGRPVFILSRNLRTENADWAHKLVKRGAHVIETFEQVVEVVESTSSELWGEKLVQGALFDFAEVPSPEGTMKTTIDAPKAALFDLDGVVVSTMVAERSAIVEIASNYLGGAVDPAAVLSTGSPPEKLRALGVHNSYAVYKAEYDRVWMRHLDHENIVFDSVVETLMQLVDDGWHVGAITSQNAARANHMVPAQVRDLFTEFVTAAGRDKSASITRLLRKWDVEPGRAFYIGDQPTDIQAAHASGVFGVAVLWGFGSRDQLLAEGPQLVLPHPKDSTELLSLF